MLKPTAPKAVGLAGETPPTKASGSTAYLPRGKSSGPLLHELSLVLNATMDRCGAVVPGTWYQSQPQQ